MSGLKSETAIPGILETMTIDDFRDFHPEVVVLPIGSTEPHGPHLPYGTDTFIADAVSLEAVRLANAAGARILRLPPLAITNNVNFKGFPFACRIRVETLMAILLDVVTFIKEEGVRKIVFLNCHGGNSSTISAALRQIYDCFQDEVFVCNCSAGSFTNDLFKDLFSDHSPHAGEYETSMMLQIAPELVRKDKMHTEPLTKAALEELQRPGVEWVRAWHKLMPDSFAGQPDLASEEKGEQFFQAATTGMADFFVKLSNEPWHPDFPFPKK